MIKRRLVLAAAIAALPAWTTTTGNAARLDLSGAVQTLDVGFAKMPAWRTGRTPWPPIAQPFTSSGFRFNASLFSGLRPSFSTRSNAAFSPAWATLGNELEAYPNADAMTELQINPFGVENGTLSITASPMNKATRATLPGGIDRSYISGALNTYPCGQTYGYFEVDARMPAGRGLWPAFWLLPVDGSWPPEIDAPEFLGHDPKTAYFSLHTTDRTWLATQPDAYNGSTTTNAIRFGSDGSLSFHRYGVDWGPQTIDFYVDGIRVARRTTPGDMHKPFYMVINLAVGGEGSWPGAPDRQTSFPATMRLRSVRVWQRPTYGETTASGR